MKIVSTVSINYKKLRFRTGKAVFLILPISFLVAIGLIISSQVNNLEVAMDKYIFNELEEENTIIQLEFEREEFGAGGFRGDTQTNFNESDLEIIKMVDHVEAATINYQIPLSSAVSNDLFADKQVSLNRLTSLDPGLVGIYTDKDFEYNVDEPIPIILNANAFVENYEDWGEEDTLTVNFRELRESGGDPRQSTPIKSRAIEYDKDALLGSTFTITFGGIDSADTFSTQSDAGVITFTKLSQEEISESEEDILNNIGMYWNTEDLAEGVTYTFEIVGIIADSENNNIYVPEGFGNDLINNLMSLQQASRNGAEIPTDSFGSLFTGLYYDGTELSTQLGGAGFGGGRGPTGGFGREAQETQTSSYEIAGLILETDSSGSEVLGEYTETDILNDSIKTGDTISIKIDDILNRSSVVNDINDAGYALIDTNDLSSLETVQSNLDKISTWVVISFIGLSGLVIILTMSKFVSESTKEIGVFRAVGFTKNNILAIFMSQAVLYTAVGFVVGLFIGLIGNFVVAGFTSAWFETFAESALESSVNVIDSIDNSIFTSVDMNSLLVLTVILFTIAIVVSYIPALKASKVSPVEAIKGE
jgi:ABC-type antimicrobial peptide transport system permease subunit